MDKLNVKTARSVGNKLPILDLVKILRKCSDSYYNSDISLISDEVFDILLDVLRERDPSNPFLNEKRAPTGKEKFKLPCWMGGLAKVKSKKQLEKWHPSQCLISDKLDGISCLVQVSKKGVKLFTGGDGNEGLDITRLLPHLRGNEAIQRLKGEMLLRGELIMSKKRFEECGGEYKNIRNMVAGVVNKVENMKIEIINNVDLVFYEVISPWLPPRDQFTLIKKLGLECVEWFSTKNPTHEELTGYVLDRKGKSDYPIDGIVVTEEGDYERCKEGDPSYSFAFKVNSEGVECEVVEVEWNASKDAYLIPKIKIKPVEWEDVTISQMTGFNADFIVANEIGPGAKVRVVRSGEVIPYITEVISPAPKGPQLPEIPYEKHSVHFIASGETDEVEIKRISKFLSCIGVESVGPGIVKKLFKNGFITIGSVLKIKVEDLLKMEGVKETLANKIYENIRMKLKGIDLVTLMVASNQFGHGFGEKRLKKIVEEIPDVMERRELRERIMEIEGFSDITCDGFLEALPKFKEFYQEIKDLVVVKEVKVMEKGRDFEGEIVVFTGFRDAAMKKKIEDGGGKVNDTVSKKTTLVIYKDGDESSSKFVKAKELGIKMVARSKF